MKPEHQDRNDTGKVSPMLAGFAEIDITPPIGTKKIGWGLDITGESVHDPLFARAAVFDNGHDRIAFIQLDLLNIRWTDVEELCAAIQKTYGFPRGNIMVSATHNHAGPAVCDSFGVVKLDVAYVTELKQKCMQVFGKALAAVEEVEIGVARSLNFDVAYNRRTMMRDGTVRHQTPSTDPDYLCLEGPRDPEVAVIAVRRKSGPFIGLIYNYACHPVHLGGGKVFSAGFPGVVADLMKDQGIPVTLFLNGAYGNVMHVDYESGQGKEKGMRDCGESLAASIKSALGQMKYVQSAELGANLQKIKLPFRELTENELKGKVRGAQRKIAGGDSSVYEKAIKEHLASRERNGNIAHPADIQALRIGDLYFVGVPGELFVEFQIRLKTELYPRQVLVVGGANGSMHYIPTKEAYKRGGYEATFPTSWLAHEAGDLIADKAKETILSMK